MQFFHLAELKKNMIIASLTCIALLILLFFLYIFLYSTHLGTISSVKIITNLCENKKVWAYEKIFRDTDCIALRREKMTLSQTHTAHEVELKCFSELVGKMKKKKCILQYSHGIHKTVKN